MKTRHLIICAAALLPILLACEKGEGTSVTQEVSEAAVVGHEEIVLGEQLEDPYSVDNITKAIASLYGTRAGRYEVTASDWYVRFLPANEDEFDTLRRMGVDLLDHPFDYKIVVDGDYYRDPDIPEDEITWQYAVVKPDFEFPSGIRYEVLDECYIPETGTVTRAGDIDLDWDAIEREAYRITGNEDMLDMLDMQTRAGSKEPPTGCITVIDPDYGDGTPLGVAGVKVSANRFVKFASAYTDSEGYYKMNKSFSSAPRYRIIFQNKTGFGIGFNMLLVQGSVSTLGKNPSSGVDVCIDSSSDRKLFCRSVVNNAVYDFFDMCRQEECSLTAPPTNLRLWLFQKISSSSAPMLRQGSLSELSLVKKYLGDYGSIVRMFLPDITLGLKGAESYQEIYSRTVHELAHASHFMQVGKSWWSSYIVNVLTSFVTSGGVTYGAGTEDGHGYCEVGEMWGYYLENELMMSRYHLTSTSNGLKYWFCPQILMYMSERGVGYNKICKALTSDVADVDALKDKLLSLYPEQKSMIVQAFERYGK